MSFVEGEASLRADTCPPKSFGGIIEQAAAEYCSAIGADKSITLISTLVRWELLRSMQKTPSYTSWSLTMDFCKHCPDSFALS